MIDTNFKGFESLIAALAAGATTDDIEMLVKVHKKILEIKNLIQDVYGVHVEYDYVKSGDYYKVELAIDPKNILSKEQADALNYIVEINNEIPLKEI